MGSGLALFPKGCQFYLFPNTALKACSVRSKSQKGFVGHYVHQNMSVFAKKKKKSKKRWSLNCLIFSDISGKMSSLEKILMMTQPTSKPSLGPMKTIQEYINFKNFLESGEAGHCKAQRMLPRIYFQLCH